MERELGGEGKCVGGMGSEQEEWGSDTHKSRDTKKGSSCLVLFRFCDSVGLYLISVFVSEEIPV